MKINILILAIAVIDLFIWWMFGELLGERSYEVSILMKVIVNYAITTLLAIYIVFSKKISIYLIPVGFFLLTELIYGFLYQSPILFGVFDLKETYFTEKLHLSLVTFTTSMILFFIAQTNYFKTAFDEK